MSTNENIAELIQFKRLYKLMNIYRDSDDTESKAALNNILEQAGFWANTPEENALFLAPFQETKRSFLVSAPDGYNWGDFPIPGEYTFAIVHKNTYGKGERSWEIDQLYLNLEPDQYTEPHKHSRGYLFTFIEEKEKLLLHNKWLRLNPEKPDYQAQLKAFQKEEEIRQKCVAFVPELAHRLWPETLEFVGESKEPEVTDPTFFKHTLSIVCDVLTSVDIPWNLPFETLQWVDDQASITQEVKYRTRDEHALRMYGIDRMVDSTEETGVWLNKEVDQITFKVKRYQGKNYFSDYEGVLKNGKLYLYISCPPSLEQKQYTVKTFKSVGMELTYLT